MLTPAQHSQPVKRATIHETRPGHWKLVLGKETVFWRGTRAVVVSVLQGLGYVVTESV